MKAELFSAMFAGLASSPDLWSWLARPETILGRVSARTGAVPKLVVDNTKGREGRNGRAGTNRRTNRRRVNPSGS
jgi:hypothetical protein